MKVSDTNVRKHGKASIAKKVEDLVPSIRSLGVLQPLLVRQNCSGFEIIAGQPVFMVRSRSPMERIPAVWAAKTLPIGLLQKVV